MSLSEKAFSRRSRLGHVQEARNEPAAEETAFTSPVMRLATVASGHYVEWGGFNTRDSLSYKPVWELDLSDRSSKTSSIGTVDEYQDEDRDKALTRWSRMAKKLSDVSLSKAPYILLYSGRRGEAELIRLLFVAAGAKYVEKNVLEDEMDRILENDTPYNCLPVVLKGSCSWGGGDAIARMLARKFYLMGQTNHEHLVVEAMFERLCRLKRSHSLVLRLLNVEIKRRERMDWVYHQLRYVILPQAMAEWEKLIMSSKGPFVVASGMTLADLAIMDFLDQCSSKINIRGMLHEDFDALYDMMMLVKKSPRIAAYLDDRAEKEFNVKFASDTNITAKR